MEIRVQGDGSLFVRMIQHDLRSDATTTNDARKDFQNLMKEYEPPITTPTHQSDDIVTLRRELIKQYGVLNTLHEFIVSNGFNSPDVRNTCSNGYLWMSFSTSAYTLVSNGLESPGKDANIVVCWPTNYTCMWTKQTLRESDGWILTDMYDAFIAAGRIFPWVDADEDDPDERGSRDDLQ
jgi:hypothetical protein